MKKVLLALALLCFSSSAYADEKTEGPIIHPANDYTKDMSCRSFIETMIYDNQHSDDNTKRRIAEFSDFIAPYILPDSKGKPIDGATELAIKRTALFCLSNQDKKFGDSLHSLKQYEDKLVDKIIQKDKEAQEKKQGAHEN